MRSPRKIELNVLRGLNELFQPHPIGRSLKNRAEDLFFHLAGACPTDRLMSIDPILKKLSGLMCIGESEQLSEEEEQSLVQALDQIRDNLGGPDFKIENLPGRLDDLTEHLNSSNIKTLVVSLLTDLEYLLVIRPKNGAAMISQEQINQAILPIKKALKTTNFSPFEMHNIAKGLKLIKELVEETPSESKVAYRNLCQLKEKIIKNAPR